MRLMVPGLNCGKSGGYRVIYRAGIVDEAWHIIFLSTYFKGGREDLAKSEYKDLLQESENILKDSMSCEWTQSP